MLPITIQRLQQIAISHTLFPSTTIKGAIEHLGFLQADPIRSPARAQDLILRQRVKAYKAGDLEVQYPALDLDEDMLFAYGFMARSLSPLLYPKGTHTLTAFEEDVLAYVGHNEAIHPKDLEATFGAERTRNAWGGFSKATKRALERLHHFGYLRVAGRRKGVRLYQRAPAINQQHSPEERFRKLAHLIARFNAPVDKRVLNRALNCLRYIVPEVARRRSLLNEVLEANGFQRGVVENREYVWSEEETISEPNNRVRFLAPFDPLVRDRDRFEHLWGWAYRFEAYTPVAKRQRGYYALPLLWRDNVIGWVNAKVENDRLKLQIGYIGQTPTSNVYQQALEQEASHVATFLHLKEDQWEFVR